LDSGTATPPAGNLTTTKSIIRTIGTAGASTISRGSPQCQLAGYKLLIVDELAYVPLSPIGAELLFETFSQRYERGSIIVTSNLPFDEWTSVFASERLTGALLDRLTHHVHILEMNGDSYRLKQSKHRPRPDD
jgi:DNA replication protein DnaC